MSLDYLQRHMLRSAGPSPPSLPFYSAFIAIFLYYFSETAPASVLLITLAGEGPSANEQSVTICDVRSGGMSVILFGCRCFRDHGHYSGGDSQTL